jgi:hypothetical protein
MQQNYKPRAGRVALNRQAQIAWFIKSVYEEGVLDDCQKTTLWIPLTLRCLRQRREDVARLQSAAPVLG